MFNIFMYLLVGCVMLVALSLLLGLLLLPVYAWVLSRDRTEAADFAEARRILGDDFPT